MRRANKTQFDTPMSGASKPTAPKRKRTEHDYTRASPVKVTNFYTGEVTVHEPYSKGEVTKIIKAAERTKASRRRQAKRRNKA